jgi:uncharacterized protein YndB with AHSA1/START domain
MSDTSKGSGLTNVITVSIRAPITEVWAAITQPDVIRQWFFGVDTETDWKKGSPITHRGRLQGKPYEDKGTIRAFEPPKLLSHSHWSPFSGRPDQPVNYEEVTYSLSERDGTTYLTIREVNLPSKEARATSERSWRGALAELKKLAEKIPAKPPDRMESVNPNEKVTREKTTRP